MTPERYQQVKQIFQATLEREPAARQAYLDALCATDSELRVAVENLLAAHQEADSFIETPALRGLSDLFANLSKPAPESHIGHYRLIREIGHGGMGAVYLAERADEAYHKEVAIKLVRYGLATPEIRRRFLSERQILAQLDHPNIARLLDGGTTDDGLPYLVMEYVEGLPLIEYANHRRLTTTQRLHLFRTICSAVHYAHINLIVHRDLKPGNILVTQEGVPKLLDFGIAKVFDASLPAEDTTRTELRAMTPGYASPEQLGGERITTASDVYSLGIILYQLLTGLRPYPRQSAMAQEIVRAVPEHQPEKPSAAITRADGEQTTVSGESPDKLRRQLKGDLDNIILMALRKEPERRYASVEQFAEDLRRYLNGLPVLARQDAVGYRASKFVRRNKAAVAAVGLLLSVIVAGIIATGWQARRAAEQARIAAEQRDKALLEQTKAERINTFFQQMLAYANPSWYAPGKGKRRDLTVIEALDEAAHRIESELHDQPDIKAEIHMTIGDTYGAIGRLDLAQLHFEKALTIRRQLFGEEHVKVAESLYYLGGAKVLLGKIGEGERLYQAALAIQRTMPEVGNNLPYMLIDYGNLFASRSEVASAEPLFREALHLFQTRYGHEHITVAIAHDYLGGAYYNWGDLDAAQSEYEEALRLSEQSPDNMKVRLKLRLAEIQIARGQHEEMEELLRESIRVHIAVFGERHHLTNGARWPLARWHYERGNYQRARREVDIIQETERLLYGDEAVQHANSKMMAAMIAHKLGQSQHVEIELREVLALYRQVHAGNDYWLVGIKTMLGEYLTDQRRYAEAETFLRECLETLRACQSPKSFRIREALQRLMALYERWGQPSQAARCRSEIAALTD